MANTEDYNYHHSLTHDSSDDPAIIPEDDEIGYVSAPIDVLGPPGKWIRHKLLEGILVGTPLLVAIQHYRTASMTRLMHAASFLGTEEFYAICVCFISWILDMRLGRMFCIAMAIGFYVANFSKNLLCLPRPPCPPIHALEEKSFATWGLPSHHAVLGVLCPWYIWFYCLLHYQFQPLTSACLFVVICLWTFGILFSRIYLGVHSPADVIAGSLVGCVIVMFMMRFGNAIESSTMMNGQGAFFVPLFVAMALLLHPYGEIGLAAFTETVCMAGVGTGFVIGRAVASGNRGLQLKALLEPSSLEPSHGTGLVTVLALMLVRFLIGGTLVALVKVTLKIILQTIAIIICKISGVKYYTKHSTSVYYTGYTSSYRLPPINQKKKSEAEEEEDEEEKSSKTAAIPKPLNIGLPVKYVTYMGMGFTCQYVVPYLFQWCGLVQ